MPMETVWIPCNDRRIRHLGCERTCALLDRRESASVASLLPGRRSNPLMADDERHRRFRADRRMGVRWWLFGEGSFASTSIAAL